MRKLIHDYALEPELAADSDEKLYQYLLNHKKFGWNAGCVIVQYPGTWKERVEKLPHDKRKLDLLFSFLREKGIICKDPIDDTICWLKNAEGLPFHVILARDNPRSQPNVVRGADIYSGSRTADKAWDQPPPSSTVDRTAASMAVCIKPMLRYAKRIRFIDPHFDPTDIKYRSPLRKFLSIICYSGRSCSVELEYHTSADGSGDDWTKFKKNCKTNLSCLIPKGFSITIRRWWNKSKGERFHNRYILTDIGGVHFGNSIKEEPKGIDTISRLSSIDSLKWNAKYSDRDSAFDPDGDPIVIRGC